MKKHIHAELIMEYAKDSMKTDKPWRRWEYTHKSSDTFHPLDTHPSWVEEHKYRKKLNHLINGIDVKPEQMPLKNGQAYYVPTIHLSSPSSCVHVWRDNTTDNILLKNGLVHLKKENAILHSEALISLTRLS